MKITGQIILVSNAGASTGAEKVWRGGKGKFFAEANFGGGGSVKLQFKSPNGTWIDYPNASFTANGMVDIELPPCDIRGVVATATASYAYAVGSHQ